MFSEEIRICLEQKEILLTQILNLTKQIEVRSNEPEVKLERFLDQRSTLMQRVDKCNELIAIQVAQMTPEQQDRVNLILNLTIDEDDCSDEERSALELVKKSNSLFQRAAALNKSANDALNRQYEEVKDKIKETHLAGKKQNMFQNFR